MKRGQRDKADPCGEGSLPRINIGLEELETFLAVAELGSFSRAAEKLALSQPSVTARVQRLEAGLGVRLLVRTTRTVTVTDAGQRLRREAETALLGLRLVLHDLRSTARADKMRVRVAATPLVAAIALPPIIRRFAQVHSRIAVHVHDVGRRVALEELSSGAADVAIMVLDAPAKGMNFQPLTSDECVVVAPLNHPLLQRDRVGFDDLVGEPILIPESYSTVRERIAVEFAKRGLPFQPAHVAVNVTTLIGMVGAGMGITFIPGTLVQGEARTRVGTVPIGDSPIIRRYGLVTVRNRPVSAATRSFCRFLRSQIPADRSGWLARADRRPAMLPPAEYRPHL